MLALTDPRWAQLETHFGDAAEVPSLIRAWQASIGTDAEMSTYEELFEHYLHQLTICPCAFAVVPHVLAGAERSSAKNRIEYFSHIGRVESCRPTSLAALEAELETIRTSTQIPADMRDAFVDSARFRSPLLPPEFADDYMSALAKAKRGAVALLDERWSPTDFARVLGAIASLFARTEWHLASALLAPASLSIDATYDGQGTLASILSDAAFVV